MSGQIPEDEILATIRELLQRGTPVEIEGVGAFELNRLGQVDFLRSGAVQVFIAYAFEDELQARQLYAALRGYGFHPWLDKEKLMPGQNWPRAIERAIDSSDFFVACLSRRSIAKRGHFQCELHYALELAKSIPLDDIFILPVRLDDCEIPRRLGQRTQTVDMFPDWERGLQKILHAIEREATRRQRRLELAG